MKRDIHSKKSPKDYPTPRGFTHGDSTTAQDRFLGGLLNSNLGAFGPSGRLRDQAFRRTANYSKRDWWLFVIGLDHNQWIRWINPANSVSLSAQIFYTKRNGQDTHVDLSQPQNVFNERDEIPGRKRSLLACQPGSTSRRQPCTLWIYGAEDWLTTFSMNTPYMGGNLRPSFVFFYDWSGSWLIQPGVDWRFWDPFALSVRYNWLDGRANRGLGVSNNKDNVWIEFQYLLY